MFSELCMWVVAHRVTIKITTVVSEPVAWVIVVWLTEVQSFTWQYRVQLR